jgi:hypothetical protein
LISNLFLLLLRGKISYEYNTLAFKRFVISFLLILFCCGYL